MAHIFISYSRENSAYVDSLVNSLTKASFNVWLDRKNLQAGQNWRAEIVEAIERADSFVLLVSGSSVASKYVRQEVYVADSSDREISSLYMEPLDLPSELKLPLAGLQAILLFEDWDAGYDKLVDMLRKQQQEGQVKIKPPLPSTRQAELSLQKGKQGNEEKKENILLLLSGILGVPAQIVKFSAEKLVINVPYHLSYELKAQALNNNPKLWKAGIMGLHFEGDKHHIPLQDPQPIKSAHNGKETRQSSAASKTSLEKIKPKLPLIIGGLMISFICIIVLFGIYLFNVASATIPPTNIPPASTLTATPNREAPPITETFTPTPTASLTITPSKTATRTPTITVTTAVPDPMTGKISGQVWDDANGDEKNSGEFLLEGIPVSLGTGSCNSAVPKATTSTRAPSFDYSFTGLAAGTYCVSVEIEEVCKKVTVPTTPTMFTITLLPSEQKFASFGFQKKIC